LRSCRMWSYMIRYTWFLACQRNLLFPSSVSRFLQEISNHLPMWSHIPECLPQRTQNLVFLYFNYNRPRSYYMVVVVVTTTTTTFKYFDRKCSKLSHCPWRHLTSDVYMVNEFLPQSVKFYVCHSGCRWPDGEIFGTCHSRVNMDFTNF
jgi:hypothetical protein